MDGTRTRAQRDAITVEIVFAFVTGAVLAGVLFVAVASPALFGDPGDAARSFWITAAAVTATAGFCRRVVRVLQGLRRAIRLG